MSTGTRTGKSVVDDVPSVLWLLGHSAWLLPIIVGFGYASWAGFLIIGLFARRWLWLAFAAGYAVAVVVIQLLPGYGTSSIVMPLLWAFSTLHGLMTNPGWLRQRWARRSASSAATEPQRGPLTIHSTAPAATVAAASPATASNPLNPATATVDELELVPFISRARAEHIVAHRGETSIESFHDLIEMLHLQPHEAVAMRGRLIFGPTAAPEQHAETSPHRSSQSSKPRVLGEKGSEPKRSESESQPPAGRILDV